jgi:hypothetical protein
MDEARSEFRAQPYQKAYQKAEKYSRGHGNLVQYIFPTKRHESRPRSHDGYVEAKIVLSWQEPPPSARSRSSRAGEEPIPIMDGPGQSTQRLPSSQVYEKHVDIMNGPEQSIRHRSHNNSRSRGNRTDPLETDEGRIIMDGPKQSIVKPSSRNAPQRGPSRHAHGKGGFQKTYERSHIMSGWGRDIEHSSSRPRRQIYGEERF